MLRLIHVINFAIIRLNEAERTVEEKDLVALFQFQQMARTRMKFVFDRVKRSQSVFSISSSEALEQRK